MNSHTHICTYTPTAARPYACVALCLFLIIIVSYLFLSRFVVVCVALCCVCVVFIMDFEVFRNSPFVVVIGGARQIPSVNVSYSCLSRFVVVVLHFLLFW